MAIATATIGSVSQFINQIKRLPDVDTELYAYRGERDNSWKTVPGIMRPDRAGLLDHERNAVRELQATHPQEFAADQTMFDRLVRMQHYELPTRLLDMTGNPLVALYFATGEVDPRLGPATDGKVTYALIPRERTKYFDSDTVSCISHLSNLSALEKDDLLAHIDLQKSRFNKLKTTDRLLQFIRTEKTYFRDQIVPYELNQKWFVWPKLSNRRIIAQNGAFIIYGLSLNTALSGGVPPIYLKHFRVLASKKHVIRIELKRLGITQGSLFPEIDKASIEITNKYCA